MPLTNDTAYYDLQSENVLRGGVMYRDMFEPNFPGVVWIHALLRPLFGRAPEVMRIFDLVVLAGIVTTLAATVRRLTGNTTRAILTAVALCWFYFSLREWSQVQRDPWLLLPAAIGVTLRERQWRRLHSTNARTAEIFRPALCEGLVWGVGVWLKPHIALSAAAVWLVSVRRAANRRGVFADFAGCVAGGALVGSLGCGWLIASGTWPHFWDTMLHWNPEYVAGARSQRGWKFIIEMIGRFVPWIAFHLAIVPLAVASVVRTLRGRSIVSNELASEEIPSTQRDTIALWDALYLVWIFQATCLQLVFDYVHVPGIMLATMLLAIRLPAIFGGAGGDTRGESETIATRLKRGLVVVALLLCTVLAIFVSPLWRANRLALWPRCVMGPATPELRNQLRRVQDPDWVDLETTAEFLATQNLQPGDLVTHDNHLIHLFWRLHQLPAVRFAYQETHRVVFPTRLQVINDDLSNCRPRFIVADLHGVLSPELARKPGPRGEIDLSETLPSRARSRFPWMFEPVFRSGGIVVLRYDDQAFAKSQRTTLKAGREMRRDTQ